MSYTPWQISSTIHPLNKQRILSYDSEFVRERHYYPKLGLIQLHQPNWQQSILYDPTNQELSALWQAIANHHAPIVVHAGRQDLELMQSIAGILPSTIRDTQLGFALCQNNPCVSYADMVEHYLGILLPKTETRSDWLARPLTEAQCDYASDDVGLLTRIYPLIVADLAHLNRLTWWQEDCQYLLQQQKENIEDYHWYKLRGAPQKLRPIHYQSAEALVNIREQIAQHKDLPRRKILSDEELIYIALKQPKNSAELAEYLPHNHIILSNIDHIETCLQATGPAPRQKRSPRLNNLQKNRFNQLERHIHYCAKDLGIHPDTIANPRQMREWIIQPETSTFNHGWRANVFHNFKG